jgi:WD40 repeat protein/tRNA A-37 threonylcarbamoyl transferase component Bud32
MPEDSNGQSDREEELNQVLRAYLEAVDAGKPPDRQEWLRQHAEFAAELEEFLADYEHVDRVVEPLRAAAVPADPSVTATNWPAGLSVGATVRYFGDYELIDEIARGGMGVVFKARQVSLNRIVAVKMVLAGILATKADRDRFHAEAQAAALLDHPNIVPVYEVGEYDGQHYFSMGYVDGLSLAARLADGPLPPKEAAELVATVAEAVEYAHRQGVIHRDIKPSNIVIDCQGRPRVTDFGLAKRVGAPGTPGRGSDLTATGQVLGTPSYMPPEQAAGQINAVGPAADVYSLGALLYTSLAGRPPFQAATPLETLQQVIDQEPVAVRQLNAAVPRDLETIVLKCLEKSVPRRYASAQALADDLQRYLEGRPILARPVSRPERLWRWCWRNRTIALLTAAVVICLIAGTAISLSLAMLANRRAAAAIAEGRRADANAARADIKADEAHAEKERANGKAAEALKERELAEKQLLRSEWLLYGIRIASAQREWEANNIVVAWQYLDACRRDFRGWEYNYLYTLFTQNQRSLKGHTGNVLSVAFSPDGKRIVGGSDDQTVKVWDAISGQELLTLKAHTLLVRTVAFSPDGKRIVSGSYDKTLKVWDAMSGRESLTFKGHAFKVESVAFSPNGKQIVSGSIDETLKVWDATSGQELLTIKGGGGRSVAFSPDGKRIVSVNADKTVQVWDAMSGQKILTLKGHALAVTSVGFSADGKRIVSGGLLGSAKVWNATSGQETLTINWSVGPVCFSPDGKRIVSGSLDDTLKVWDAASGQEMQTFKGQTGPLMSVAVSPDGKRIVSSSNGALTLWDAASSQGTLTPTGHSGRVTSVAFSPDGRRIVSGSEDKTLKVWDATSGRETLTVTGLGLPVRSVAFSPDGKRIVSGGDGVVGVTENISLKIWSATSGRKTLMLKGRTGPVSSVAFSPDGKRVVSGSTDKTLKVWDAASGRETLTLKGHTGAISSVAFSPDGKRIVSGSYDKTLKVWNAMSGQETLTLKGHTDEVSSVAFSPNGKRIVSGSFDNTLKLWDATSGQESLTLKGHTDVVASVAFSPNGKRIVSGGYDDTLKLWDATSGQETLTLKAHAGGVNSVAFSPDGMRIVSGGNDNTLKVWDATNSSRQEEEGKRFPLYDPVPWVRPLFRRPIPAMEFR